MIEVKKEILDDLKITPFDLTSTNSTNLDENDQVIIAGHPVIDGVQKPLQLSRHRCMHFEGK